jgi:FtsZ-interacting cell division protein YlmF
MGKPVHRYRGKSKKHKVAQQSPQSPPASYSAAQASYKIVSIKPKTKHETQQLTDANTKNVLLMR